MPDDSPFKPSWWYRTEFDLPRRASGTHRLAALRRHQLPREHLAQRTAARRGQRGRGRVPPLRVRRHAARARRQDRNVLAVEVDRARAARPRDHVGGLEPHARRQEHGPLGRRLPDRQRAARAAEPARGRRRSTCRRSSAATLTVTAEVWNATDAPVHRHRARHDRATSRSRQPVSLGPRERKTIAFTPEQVKALNISKPRVWWPYRMGAQDLYTLALTCGGATGATPIGEEVALRHPADDVRADGQGAPPLQGQRQADPDARRRLGLRHAAAAPPRRSGCEAELRYVREMGLNTIRLEGKLETDEFYDLADEYGHPGHARLVLLRPVGEVGQVGRRGPRGRRPRRCAIRSCACATTRACSRG